MAPKTPAGEMTAPELRKLIRAHNILSKITIPKGTDRNGLIKLIEGKNYTIDHKNKVIKPQQQRGKQITLKQAEELTKPKPVSEEVKKARAEKKKEQEEEKKKEIKVAKKEAVQEFKKKQKEAKKEIKKAEKLNKKKDLKIKSISNNKKDMGETAFIKQQKKLQLQKQKETRRALLKSKVEVDKTTRRGKPVKKEELEQSIAQKKADVEIMKKKNEEINKKLSTEEKKKKIKELEEQVKKKEEALKKKEVKKEVKKEENKEVKKEGKKIGRPKGAKTILNFSKLKKEGMERLFKELDIMGPYRRQFNTEDFTIPQLRKWLKWLINSDEFSPLPDTFKEVKGKELDSIYPFYTFNWYSYPSDNENEKYYEKDRNTEEKKKKFNERVQELRKEGKSMISTHDDMILNPENKNITKSDLIKKLNKFVEEEKKKEGK